VVYGQDHTIDHTVEDMDQLWSHVGESWNPLVGEAAA
jgi:hypothetical protein